MSKIWAALRSRVMFSHHRRQSSAVARASAWSTWAAGHRRLRPGPHHAADDLRPDELRAVLCAGSLKRPLEIGHHAYAPGIHVRMTGCVLSPERDSWGRRKGTMVPPCIDDAVDRRHLCAVRSGIRTNRLDLSGSRDSSGRAGEGPLPAPGPAPEGRAASRARWIRGVGKAFRTRSVLTGSPKELDKLVLARRPTYGLARLTYFAAAWNRRGA